MMMMMVAADTTVAVLDTVVAVVVQHIQRPLVVRSYHLTYLSSRRVVQYVQESLSSV